MSELATRAAILKFLADKVKAATEQERLDLADELMNLNESFGVKSVEAKLGDEVIANITLTKRADTVAIRDESAFARWAESVMPNSTQVMVKPEARAYLIDRMRSAGSDVFDRDSGDLLDFATTRAGATFPTIRLKEHGDPIQRAIERGFNPLLALEEGDG